MKSPRLPVTLTLAGMLCAASLQASETDNAAWHQFQHALGEPAHIGANASHALADTAFRPIPPITLEEIHARKYLLGNDLFHERRLSSDNSTACVSCHGGPISGTDGRAVSIGVQQARGRFNALSTFNTAFNFRQFWDGRAITLADQSLEPIVNEVEMANTLDAVLNTLREDRTYADDFRALYPDGLTINNVADAMAHFQRIAFTVTDTPFQRHLNGEADQLSEQAIRGLERFREIGCSACHNGINLGGNSYQKLGTLRAYYPERREAGPNNSGLAARTGRPQDLHVVKVPGMHSVSMTMPYFHDGSVPTLNAAIADMALFQLGRDLDPEAISDIAEFLRSSSGRPFGLHMGSEIEKLAHATPLPELSSEPGTHQRVYSAAIDAIGPAWIALQTEMERLQSGEVAHFDFVQFQHLELIRHARALQFPPADLSVSNLSCLQSAAPELLEEVLALEWPIADFLQAQAMLAVFEAHVQTPDQHSPEPDALEAQMAVHRHVASQHLSKIAEAAISATAGKLRNCTL
jgi:cytochrome c peroxidase